MVKRNLSFALSILFSCFILKAGEPNAIDPNYALLEAALKNEVISMQNCLDQKSDPDFQEVTSGRAALHYATQDEFSTMLLLDYGADPDIQDWKGLTPLHIAAKKNRKTTIAELFEHKADPNIRDNHGNTPLHYAVTKKYGTCIKMLLQNGACDDIPNNENITAQNLAAISDPRITKLFFFTKAAHKR